MSQAIGRDGHRPPYLPPPIKPSALPILVDPQTLPHPRTLAHEEAITAAGRQRALLERYSRKRRELVLIQQELLEKRAGDTDDEGDESGEGDGWDVVEGLRASLHTKRRDVARCQAEIKPLLLRIDGQDAELQRLRPMTTEFAEHNSSLRHNLRLHQKREHLRELEESSLRDQLEMSLSDERDSELGKMLEEKSLLLLQREKELSRTKTALQKLQVKAKATAGQLEKERHTMKRLRESPKQRQIEQKLAHMRREDAAASFIQAKVRGDQAREEAAKSMRMASRIQALQRARNTRKQMREDAMALVANARHTRQQVLEARKDLARVDQALRERERTLQQRSRDLEKVEQRLGAARLDLDSLKSKLREARLSLSAVGRLEARANASDFLRRLRSEPTPELQAISVSEALSAAAETLYEAATPSGSGAPPMLFNEQFVSGSSPSRARSTMPTAAGSLEIALPGDESSISESNEANSMSMSPSSALLEKTIDDVDAALDGLLLLRSSLGKASFEDPLQENSSTRKIVELEQ